MRPATLDDTPALQVLMSQLGYPASLDAFARRIAAVLGTPGNDVIVAEREGVVLGLAHAAALPLLEDEGSVHLLALVVDETARGQGIGARLVAEVEAWGAARGCTRVVVRSSIGRTRTHGFYERLGFLNTKTQYQFRKSLQGSAP